MKILLAEADGAPAGRLFHLLVKNGYQTTAVKTGQAALDEIGRSYVDMVIAEACTPAVDGCALVRSLRAAGSPTPVLLLTERARRGHAPGLLSGAHDCLIKPVDDNELLLRIPALQRRTQTGGERCRNLSFLSSTTLDPKRASAAVYSDCRACACEKTYAQVQKEQSSRGARGGKARLE